MNAGKIKTYQDLLEEEQRMLMQFKRDKASVVEDFNRIKNKLRPAEQFFSTVNKWFQVPPSKEIFPRVMDVAVDILSKKWLFKNTGWVKSFLGSYALRTATQWVMGTMRKRNEHAQDGTDETLNQ